MLKKSIVFMMLFLMIASSIVVCEADFSNGSTLPIKIEGEWYDKSNANVTDVLTLTNDAANSSGGAVVNLNSDVSAPADGYYVGYDIVVQKAGIYEMSILSSLQGKSLADGTYGSGPNNLSAYKVSVNGDLISVSDIAYKLSVRNIGGIAYYTYKLNIALKDGTNDIRFVVKDRATVTNGKYVMYIDKFELLYKSNNLKIRTEGEMIANRGNIPSSTTNDFSITYVGGSIGRAFYGSFEAPTNWSYDVEIPEEGMYYLNITGYELSDLPSSTGSNYIININNGSDISISLSNSDLVYKEVVVSGSKLNLYRLRTPMLMVKGVNTLKVTIPNLAPSGGRYKTVIDCFEFQKAGSDIISDVTMEGESAYSGTNFTLTTGLTTSNFSNNNAVWFYYTPANTAPENHTITFNFDIIREDSFEIYLNSSNLFRPDILSPISILIDGENLPVTDATWRDIGQIGTLDAVAFKKYKCLTPISLSVGQHTMSITVTDPATTLSLNRFYFLLDKIDIKSVKNPTNATVEVGNSAIAYNQQTTAITTVYTNCGDTINSSDYTVTYSSENTNIATVDPSTGVVTGKAPGKTRIIATCDVSGQQFTAYTNITVLTVSGIELVSKDLQGNNVIISVASWLANSSATFVVLVRDKVDGVFTSSKEIKTYVKGDWKIGMPATISIPLSSVVDNMDVKLYMWNDIDGIVPLWQPEFINSIE